MSIHLYRIANNHGFTKTERRQRMSSNISMLGSKSAITCCSTSHSAGRCLYYAQASQTWRLTHQVEIALTETVRISLIYTAIGWTFALTVVQTQQTAQSKQLHLYSTAAQSLQHQERNSSFRTPVHIRPKRKSKPLHGDDVIFSRTRQKKKLPAHVACHRDCKTFRKEKSVLQQEEERRQMENRNTLFFIFPFTLCSNRDATSRSLLRKERRPAGV